MEQIILTVGNKKLIVRANCDQSRTAELLKFAIQSLDNQPQKSTKNDCLLYTRWKMTDEEDPYYEQCFTITNVDNDKVLCKYDFSEDVCCYLMDDILNKSREVDSQVESHSLKPTSEIDKEATILRIANILDYERNLLQNKWDKMNHSFIPSSSKFKEFSTTVRGYKDSDSSLLCKILANDDYLARHIQYFLKMKEDPKTKREGIFLFYHYVIGAEKKKIYMVLGCPNDKRKQKEIRDSAYLKIAIELNQIVYKSSFETEIPMLSRETV